MNLSFTFEFDKEGKFDCMHWGKVECILVPSRLALKHPSSNIEKFKYNDEVEKSRAEIPFH